MEHIRQFDWLSYSQSDIHFLQENDLENSITEKILHNKFRDPMISSDSDDEPPNINWDEVFSKRENYNRTSRMFVPCMPKNMQYPKLSTLTSHQHYQCLRVLCMENPHVLPEEFWARPTKSDHKAFMDLKPIYEKEQKEFIDWAKTQWTTVHCIRALRPKPPIEHIYDAKFKMRKNEMQSFPKIFDMAAQIPLETRNNVFDMISSGDLKNIDIKLLPQIECGNITRKLTIMNQYSVPEPCNKHPCRFVLPKEKSVSILPLTEVQRELANYALDNNCQYIASENSIKCLMELDRKWDLTVAVLPVIGPDGESTNVVVLGDEFSINREPSVTRTYKAFKHLLEHTLIPKTEKYKLRYQDPDDNDDEEETSNNNMTDVTDTSSDEDDNLCIIENSDLDDDTETAKEQNDDKKKSKTNNKKRKMSEEQDQISFFSCTCKDTMFERPPPRSFKKWQVRNRTTDVDYNIIIHCSHKVRDKNGEVLLEPILEYQMELGASAQSKEKLRSLALSLILRENVTLINARIDGVTGEVALFEHLQYESFKLKHGDLLQDVSNILHTALDQLQGLMPGIYVLRHEPSHGHNAILYVSKPSTKSSFVLEFDSTQLVEADEAKHLKIPPVLIPVLLPHHKFLKQLPCAWSPDARHVAQTRDTRTPRRNRAPPRALEWPKKKRNKKKKKN